jgi:hypothetical protein
LNGGYQVLAYSENSEKSTQDRVELMASRMSDHLGKEPRARVSPNRGDIVTWIWDDASWICTIHEFNTKELSFPSETQPLPTVSLLDLAFAFGQKPNLYCNNRSLQF